MELREEKIKELRAQAEYQRETEARLNTAIQTLRSKLGEYEAHSTGLEGTVNRTEIVLQTLQEDNRSAQEKIIDLEGRLRLAERFECFIIKTAQIHCFKL